MLTSRAATQGYIHAASSKSIVRVRVTYWKAGWLGELLFYNKFSLNIFGLRFHFWRSTVLIFTMNQMVATAPGDISRYQGVPAGIRDMWGGAGITAGATLFTAGSAVDGGRRGECSHPYTSLRYTSHGFTLLHYFTLLYFRPTYTTQK